MGMVMQGKQFWRRVDRHALVLALFVVVLGYVAARAAMASFTHDESVSYSIALSQPSDSMAANHHLLNTLLMAAMAATVGDREFMLRFPNLLAFGVYLVACFGLIGRDDNRWRMLTGAALLVCNPFLLEFFSLARGYGIAVTCVTVSIYCLLRIEPESATPRAAMAWALGAAVGGALAVLANLTTVTYLIVLMILLTLRYVAFVRGRAGVSLAHHLGFAGVQLIQLGALAYGISALLALKDLGQLYYGSDSLWAALRSFVDASVYFMTPPSWVTHVGACVIVLTVALAVVSVVKARAWRGRLATITAMLLAVVLGWMLEHLLVGAKYPQDRTGMFIFPIYSLMLYELIVHLSSRVRAMQRPRAQPVLCAAVCVPLALHLMVSMNLLYTWAWRYDAHTRQVAEAIDAYIRSTDRTPTISHPWMFEPTMNYYIYTRKLSLPQSKRTGVMATDIVYTFTDGVTPQVWQAYEALLYFQDTETLLLVRKGP